MLVFRGYPEVPKDDGEYKQVVDRECVLKQPSLHKDRGRLAPTHRRFLTVRGNTMPKCESYIQ